jgi:hypothetical protein
VALGIILIFLLRCCLALIIFPFPVTTAKLIGEFYNNRRSVAHGCPFFAYSFMFLMLRQYYWRCAPLIGEAQRIKKNPQKLLIGSANLSRFDYWCSKGAPLRL